MNRPRVSVIVPAYNTEKYIETAIDDLRNQTYPNLEIIVVDDGSTDHTLDICEAKAKVDRRIRIISKENGGVASARNAGLQAATGEWIGFMDADDRIDPEMYELMINSVERYPCDCAACRFVTEYSEKISLKFPHVTGFETKFIEGNKACLMSISSNNSAMGVFVWNKIFKKTIIKDLKFDMRMSVLEDAFFVYQALAKAKRIQVMDVPCYHYRYSFDGLTRNSKTTEYLRGIEGLGRLVHYFEAKELVDVAIELKKYCLFLSARCLESVPLFRSENDQKLCNCARNNIHRYYAVLNYLTPLKRLYVIAAMKSFVIYKLGVVVKRNSKRMWLAFHR